MEGLQSLEEGGGQIKTPDFPIHIFPQQLQQIIKCYCSNLNLNIDYAAVTVLYAFSVALGGHYSLTVKRGWVELPTLFIALVGKPGINKSGPISIFTQPLEKLEKDLFKRFLDEYSTFRKGRSVKKETSDLAAITDEPVRRQLVIKDATQEAMLKALYDNPHGFGGIYDELAAFLKSFNKYKTGGGDEEVMLSLFSGKSISVNRKSSEPIFIEKPFISIIGSIQPQVLINLLGNNKIDNGLTHRFLFAFPDNVIREDLSDEDVPEYIEELYQTFINRILISEFFHADGYPSHKISLSKDGYEAYKVFRRKINETINNEKSDAISGIYAKLDTYSLRIALILHVMLIGCNEPDINPYQVSADTFCKAAELIQYFEHSALKVFKLMEKFRDPLNGYPMEHKIIYYQLPYSFTTSTAWEIAKEKVSRRTLFNMLSDEYLFNKLKHGIYEKIW
ncbi:MAG: YfjI family protein [Bacteroidota bacterium]|nr:YfjI family protein [Bacteroidota bacterium]